MRCSSITSTSVGSMSSTSKPTVMTRILNRRSSPSNVASRAGTSAPSPLCGAKPSTSVRVCTHSVSKYADGGSTSSSDMRPPSPAVLPVALSRQSTRTARSSNASSKPKRPVVGKTSSAESSNGAVLRVVPGAASPSNVSSAANSARRECRSTNSTVTRKSSQAFKGWTRLGGGGRRPSEIRAKRRYTRAWSTGLGRCGSWRLAAGKRCFNNSPKNSPRTALASSPNVRHADANAAQSRASPNKSAWPQSSRGGSAATSRLRRNESSRSRRDASSASSRGCGGALW
mmetsp:Transcript_1225/g.3408  ORF Transcript_1225/g.3408 Transcript_1225/m.3408 type:complete len:286 (+) Transcript_1225:98-955(+)